MLFRSATVSVFDHGLLYGDGVFEGIRFYNGRVFRLAEHIERLYWSAKAILLEIPISPKEMSRAVVETCRATGLRDGYAMGDDVLGRYFTLGVRFRL